MSRARLLAGWIVVVIIAGMVSVSTLVVVREAVGGGTVVDALSQADVAAQYVVAQSHAAGSSAPTSPSSSVDTSGAGGTTATTSGRPVRSGTAPRASGPAARAVSPASTPSSVDPRPAGGSPSPGAASSSPAVASVTRVLTSGGGSVVARCTGAGSSESESSDSQSVYLVSWSPAQGYAVDHARRGPGEEAEIEFESSSTSVSVTFRCSPSGPVQSVESDDGWGDDGGGDGGGDD